VDSSEQIVINPCPNCETEGGHAYFVPIEREMVFGLMTTALFRETRRNINVIFRCPVKSTPFKVTLRLWETSNSRIREVGEPMAIEPQEKADG